MDLLEKMEQLLQDCREDYNKAKGGNKAAGTRGRKVMQDVKNVAQDIRKEMLGTRDCSLRGIGLKILGACGSLGEGMDF